MFLLLAVNLLKYDCTCYSYFYDSSLKWFSGQSVSNVSEGGGEEAINSVISVKLIIENGLPAVLGKS